MTSMSVPTTAATSKRMLGDAPEVVGRPERPRQAPEAALLLRPTAAAGEPKRAASSGS